MIDYKETILKHYTWICEEKGEELFVAIDFVGRYRVVYLPFRVKFYKKEKKVKILKIEE